MNFNEFYEQIVLPAKKINPHHIRLDGEIAGGNRKIFGSFTHNNRIWKVHSDTHYEPLMLAYEYSCLDCEKNDPFIRCRPWRAKRRPVVPGRRRRGRLAGVAEGRSPEAAEARCKRIRYAVKPFDVGPWRSPTAPLGARRDGAVARSGANRGTRVVAERKAKGGTGKSRFAS